MPFHNFCEAVAAGCRWQIMSTWDAREDVSYETLYGTTGKYFRNMDEVRCACDRLMEHRWEKFPSAAWWPTFTVTELPSQSQIDALCTGEEL